MRTGPGWSDQVPQRDGVTSTVWDLAYRPDGGTLVVAVGNRVLVYDAIDGDLLHSLKGHKDTVYTVDYSCDGKRFASGAADKMVIIWDNKAQGVLKYSHNDTIQKIKYNPVSQQLASCSSVDFGLWSPDQKSVTKHKLGAKALCCDWTKDGQYLAIGLFNGTVTVRDKAGEEKFTMTRNAPVWSLAWSPSNSALETYDVLCIACWDDTLSFYQLNHLNGVQLLQYGKDRKLDYNPCTVSYFGNGEYLLVGGSNKEINLYTKEGIKLVKIADTDGWCWAAKSRPKNNSVAVGSHNGTIATHSLIFGTVHGLYKDRYAYRENMTEVTVQHLITEHKARIRCKDYIKKISIYRNRLAVQLPDKVVIYELTNPNDPYDLKYRVREKIHKSLTCNLLVVTSLHVILCLEKKLQLFDFKGHKEKEWVLESVIRYIKVVGGPEGREGILVGLKNGTVLQIFVNNPFPIVLIKQRTAIRCLDLSLSRKKLAVIDDTGACLVYDLTTKELLFEEADANSVAWNTELEDMLCFSGNDMLSIKTGDFPIHQQKMQGFVVGFNGSKIFCLHSIAMQTIDVPQSASLYRYLAPETKNYPKAYKIACLGVTDSDWKLLAVTCLQGLDFVTARKAFTRIKDVRYIELIDKIEKMQKMANYGKENKNRNDKELKVENQMYIGEILAYQGRYQDAAKLYNKCGHIEKAIDMFSDLRQWEAAKNFAQSSGSVDVKELIKRQAEWCEETNDIKAAADMYCAAGQYDKAIKLVGERGWLDELIEVARTLNKSETKSLQACANYFRKHNHHLYTKEVYLKMDDVPALMKLHVDLHKWQEAFLLSQQHGDKYAADVYLPYANWLAENDRFDEAQAAYKKAKNPEHCIKMLEELSQGAILEERYRDAAYYLFLLSDEKLSLVKHDSNNLDHHDLTTLNHATLYRELAQQYFAYGTVSKYTEQPFSTIEAETVFNTARFLVNMMSVEAPTGISRSSCLSALGKQAKALGAYKLARYSFDKLGQLKLPNDLVNEVELEMLMINSKPYKDSEELLDICYRCSTTNPLVNNTNNGDVCIQCSHSFVRSFRSFDSLPLVEFIPGDNISDERAVQLLISEPVSQQESKNEDGEWKNEDHGTHQSLTFNDDADADDPSVDAFAKFMMTYEFDQPGEAYQAMVVPEHVLKHTSYSEVFVCKWKCKGRRWQFFKNVIPDVRVLMCDSCNTFFHEEDLETSCLESGGDKCPFCRTTITF